MCGQCNALKKTVFFSLLLLCTFYLYIFINVVKLLLWSDLLVSPAMTEDITQHLLKLWIASSSLLSFAVVVVLLFSSFNLFFVIIIMIVNCLHFIKIQESWSWVQITFKFKRFHSWFARFRILFFFLIFAFQIIDPYMQMGKIVVCISANMSNFHYVGLCRANILFYYIVIYTT